MWMECSVYSLGYPLLTLSKTVALNVITFRFVIFLNSLNNWIELEETL